MEEGRSLIGDIVSGVVICWLFSLLYIYYGVIRRSATNVVRVLLVTAAALALAYALYYKYVVYTLTGTPGFLNAYERIFVHLTAIEGISFLLLIALLSMDSWKLIKGIWPN